MTTVKKILDSLDSCEEWCREARLMVLDDGDHLDPSLIVAVNKRVAWLCRHFEAFKGSLASLGFVPGGFTVEDTWR